MKTKSFLIVAFSLLAFTSCSKMKEALFPSFEAELEPAPITIPITGALASWQNSYTFNYNLDSVIRKFSANSFGVNNINSVYVKSLNFFIENSDAQNNVSNFDSLSLQIASDAHRASATVAQTAVPDVQTDILNIAGNEATKLNAYFEGSRVTYTLAGKMRRPTTKPLNATVSVTLMVK